MGDPTLGAILGNFISATRRKAMVGERRAFVSDINGVRNTLCDSESPASKVP
jgi:hypothetical protein